MMERECKVLLEEKGFQVLRTLGKGAFGIVFQVKKEEYGTIAAKVMNEDEFDANEWRTGFRLSHQNHCPFILNYISTTMYGLKTIILMEYANLKNLDTLIETKKEIPIPIIRAIMKQLLEGLRTMHDSGIIHRDIKGQNILLNNLPGSRCVQIKIADLGLAKIQRNVLQSMTMTVVGTFPYMPPELTMDNAKDVKADAKVDVWAAGIIFHQLVTH
ncbi:MAG: putative AGC family protein kinase, partial [Streblomastix strix]